MDIPEINPGDTVRITHTWPNGLTVAHTGEVRVAAFGFAHLNSGADPIWDVAVPLESAPRPGGDENGPDWKSKVEIIARALNHPIGTFIRGYDPTYMDDFVFQLTEKGWRDRSPRLRGLEGWGKIVPTAEIQRLQDITVLTDPED